MKSASVSLFVLLAISFVSADRLAALEQRVDRVEAENVNLKRQMRESREKLDKIVEENSDLKSQIEQLAEAREKLDKTVEEKDELEERVAKLEELSKVNVLRSCAEYQQYGFSRSGFYLVDPDGSLIGNPPFRVKTSSAGL